MICERNAGPEAFLSGNRQYLMRLSVRHGSGPKIEGLGPKTYKSFPDQPQSGQLVYSMRLPQVRFLPFLGEQIREGIA